jgi:hypothetical protein
VTKTVVNVPLTDPGSPQQKLPSATQTRDAAPLVAIVPLTNRAPVQFPPSANAAQAGKASANPAHPAAVPGQDAPGSTTIVKPAIASTPPNTTATTPAPGLDPSASAVLTPEAEALERKRFELASRRDRLVRLGESKINSGDVEEGLASFEQALETANELVQRTDGGHDEVMELALLYRRLGNVVTSVKSTAEGRTFFDRGRRALQTLRSSGKLPREAGKILTDLENLARNTRE